MANKFYVLHCEKLIINYYNKKKEQNKLLSVLYYGRFLINRILPRDTFFKKQTNKLHSNPTLPSANKSKRESTKHNQLR